MQWSSPITMTQFCPMRYAVIGNPVEHSCSPYIHQAFAQQTGIDLLYDKLHSPLDKFAQTVNNFVASGGRGLNVTTPFKLDALALSTQVTARARAAGAVNTLKFLENEIHGDNTDGIGLVEDIQKNLGYLLQGKKILLLGAGGAARGVLLPLVQCAPAAIFIANRTAAKAQQLVMEFAPLSSRTKIAAGNLEQAPYGYDVLINASAAGLNGHVPLLAKSCWSFEFVYDMMYGDQATAFLQNAAASGAKTADGLGMLVMQAAHSFMLWHGIFPDTLPVLRALRQGRHVKR